MATEEALTLDGLALNDGTAFGMVTFDAPVPRQRQDWIGAADSEAQLLIRNPLHENRKITVTLVVVQQATMDLALDKIGQIQDKLGKASKYTDGITLTWAPATSSRSVTFDVLSGEITGLPITFDAGWFARSPEITVELTCKPYWRGSETLVSTASSGTAPFVAQEIASVTGDVPALGRLIVTDTASQARRHVEWGIEGPTTYNSATSLIVDSDSMVTSGFAGTQTTTANAYDPNASGNDSITLNVAPSLVSAMCGTGNLSHVGVFRVKARVFTSVQANRFRLSWQAGDGSMASNEWAQTHGTASWEEIDLGTVTVPTTVSGTQRWTGRVEVLGAAVTAGTAILDYLLLIPVSNGYGKARAAYRYTPGSVVAQDYFISTTAGDVLNGRTAPTGGSWATSGSSTDFVFNDSASGRESIRRSTISDSGPRWAILGSAAYSDVQVDVDLYQSLTILSASATVAEGGPIARWVDSSNYLRAVASRGGASRSLSIIARVGGVDTVLATTPVTFWITDRYYCIRLIAFSSGRVLAFLLDSTKTVTIASVEASSSVLTTGGTLDDGKPGIYDFLSGTVFGSFSDRYYDNFSVSVPPTEPVAIYSGRTMQVRHDDVIRDDSTGTYTGRPSSYRGSRFLVPVGTSRVFVRATRNDLTSTQDDFSRDATQIQVGWTARGLAVPR